MKQPNLFAVVICTIVMFAIILRLFRNNIMIHFFGYRMSVRSQENLSFIRSVQLKVVSHVHVLEKAPDREMITYKETEVVVT